MALVGRRDGRNFGYGRQLSYAGPQALKDMFGGGHYGTVKAHCDRWQAFVKWCRSEQGPGINDARQIDREVLADYAAYLRDMVTCERRGNNPQREHLPDRFGPNSSGGRISKGTIHRNPGHTVFQLVFQAN